jgi:hypothetical protein
MLGEINKGGRLREKTKNIAVRDCENKARMMTSCSERERTT